MSQITDFLASPDPVIADAAKRLAELTAAMQRGDYTADEFRELVADGLDYDRISADIRDNDRKIKIQEAMAALLLIAQAAMALKP